MSTVIGSLRTPTAALACLVLLGCTGAPVQDSQPASRGGDADVARTFASIDSAAAAIDRIFQPLPLLTPATETALRRSTNAQHIARARVLGIQPGLPSERLAALRNEGRIVAIENTRHYVVRELDQSQPLAVAAVPTVLSLIGERFHARLAALGAPPFRLEITSLLRTAADQEALRQVNPNAATGESTHEFGTTFDLLYSAYAAPAQPIVPVGDDIDTEFVPLLRRYADIAAERVAGRRALELKAILGEVLREMQNEGRILVTIERLQPVYHVTLARNP